MTQTDKLATELIKAIDERDLLAAALRAVLNDLTEQSTARADARTLLFLITGDDGYGATEANDLADQTLVHNATRGAKQ